MNARMRAVKELEDAGYAFARHGANHDIYFNANTKTMISLKRHDFDGYIRKEIKAGHKRG